MDYRKKFFVDPDETLRVRKLDPGYNGDHESEETAKQETEDYRAKLAHQQALLYAQRKHSVLVETYWICVVRFAAGKLHCSRSRLTKSQLDINPNDSEAEVGMVDRATATPRLIEKTETPQLDLVIVLILPPVQVLVTQLSRVRCRPQPQPLPYRTGLQRCAICLTLAGLFLQTGLAAPLRDNPNPEVSVRSRASISARLARCAI